MGLCRDVKRYAAFKMAEAAQTDPPGGVPRPALWNFQIKQFYESIITV